MGIIVTALSNPEASDINIAGGKGATLSRMISEGIKVPDGYVITSEALAALIPSYVSDRLTSLKAISANDIEAITEVSDSIQAALNQVPLRDDLLDAIKDAHGRLQSPAVSIRSSATAEDMHDASFAGQYESFLNVIGFDKVVSRIRNVWASLYSTRAIAYRMRIGINHQKVRMAVIVQRQIHPVASGVLFTRNPITGAPNFVVNATFGLGHGVVSGEIPVDQFELASETNKIITSVVAVKAEQFVSVPSGGIKISEVPVSVRTEPSLSERHLQHLLILGKHLESVFKGPQDVEFAIANEEIHILQSRPITGQNKELSVNWEEDLDANYTWVLSDMTTTKGPVYRLQLDAAHAYLAGLRQCYKETASEFSHNHIMHMINDYIYVRAPDDDNLSIADRQRRHATKCKTYIDQGTTNYLQETVPKIHRIHEKLRTLRNAGKSISHRVKYLEACIDASGFIMGHLHWCMIDQTNKLDWPSEFHNITGEPAENSHVFLQAIPNRTTRLIRRLWILAQFIKEDAIMNSAFFNRRFDILESTDYFRMPNLKIFKKRFRSLIKDYGFRTGWGYGSTVAFDTSTWSMDHNKPLELIASYAERDIDKLKARESATLRQRQLATRRLRRKLSTNPKGLAKFEFARKQAQSDVARMEDHNYLMEQSTVGQMRDAMHEMGTSLVTAGLLNAPHEVLHLSMDELKNITKDTHMPSLLSLVSDRVATYAMYSQLTPPRTLGKPEKVLSVKNPEPTTNNQTGLLLKGRSASRGRSVGRARIVDAAKPPPRFHEGDILVSTNVGPDWTPFFPLVAGIVLDHGEISQHPALIAREYRIPAVFQTQVGTSRIREGQTIIVNGDTGFVELAST